MEEEETIKCSEDNRTTHEGNSSVEGSGISSQRRLSPKISSQSKRKSPASQAAKKRPDDIPKRPLSAYNLFFKQQREQMLALAAAMSTDTLKEQPGALAGRGRRKATSRKSGRPSGLGFANLAKTIGERWKNLKPDEKEPFEQRAAADKVRYEIDMTTWRRKKADEEIEFRGGEMPKRPLSAYNYFFKEQRQLIMESKGIMPGLAGPGLAGKGSLKSASDHGPRAHRKHVKSSGLGFANLAKTIAERWKALEAKDKVPYEERAAVDKARYDQEVEEWRYGVKRTKSEDDPPPTTKNNNHLEADATASSRPTPVSAGQKHCPSPAHSLCSSTAPEPVAGKGDSHDTQVSSPLQNTSDFFDADAMDTEPLPASAPGFSNLMFSEDTLQRVSIVSDILSDVSEVSRKIPNPKCAFSLDASPDYDTPTNPRDPFDLSLYTSTTFPLTASDVSSNAFTHSDSSLLQPRPSFDPANPLMGLRSSPPAHSVPQSALRRPAHALKRSKSLDESFLEHRDLVQAHPWGLPTEMNWLDRAHQPVFKFSRRSASSGLSMPWPKEAAITGVRHQHTHAQPGHETSLGSVFRGASSAQAPGGAARSYKDFNTALDRQQLHDIIPEPLRRPGSVPAAALLSTGGSDVLGVSTTSVDLLPLHSPSPGTRDGLFLEDLSDRLGEDELSFFTKLPFS